GGRILHHHPCRIPACPRRSQSGRCPVPDGVPAGPIRLIRYRVPACILDRNGPQRTPRGVARRSAGYDARPSLHAAAMPHPAVPLLTLDLARALLQARSAGASGHRASLDLGRSQSIVDIGANSWQLDGSDYPYPGKLRDRTIYYPDGDDWSPVSRYAGSLIKLVPTAWGPPTFEIDGIKMLPTARESPLDDARRKVALVQPRGRTILDTCGGLGYFAGCCLEAGAARIVSFEKNPSVLWLRTLNPWSPDPASADAGGRLDLRQGDVAQAITALPEASF